MKYWMLIGVVLLVGFVSGLTGYGIPKGKDSKGPTAECIVLKQDVEKLSYLGRIVVPKADNERARSVVDRYNANCR